MIDFLEGEVFRINPAYVVLNVRGVGYGVNISLNTYEKIKDHEGIRILTHLVVKEDSHSLFGFAEEDERVLFRKLISVSGVGTSTARMLLSSLSPNDLVGAISTGNVALLKSVKGIGPKAAQRLIVELQDKVGSVSEEIAKSLQGVNKQMSEAMDALSALGFPAAKSQKVLLKVRKEFGDSLTTEDLIKKSLQLL